MIYFYKTCFPCNKKVKNNLPVFVFHNTYTQHTFMQRLLEKFLCGIYACTDQYLDQIWFNP